ncbi:hypothetical protein [Quadrisphaera sp. DSM 44207]|uniref:hypothetical protein n=1 Tax=Quadrisphaera sp. DSM 44207 TaxID=1881057 RepID=UPI000B870902|nr:hypothetical protein [Quadrisphaera sp. DSM 44207]
MPAAALACALAVLAGCGWPLVEGLLGSAEDRARSTDPVLVRSSREASPSGLAETGDAVCVAALRGPVG